MSQPVPDPGKLQHLGSGNSTASIKEQTLKVALSIHMISLFPNIREYTCCCAYSHTMLRRRLRTPQDICTQTLRHLQCRSTLHNII